VATTAEDSTSQLMGLFSQHARPYAINASKI